MNRKEILRDSFKKTKQFFWIYLAAVAILFIASGISDGIFGSFDSLNRFLLSMRSGIFTYENIMDTNSEVWSVMTAKRGLLSNSGIVGFLAALFVANPLSVGISRLFLQDRPDLSAMSSVFKSNYWQLVKVTFVYNFLLSIIFTAISAVYMVAAYLGIGMLALSAEQLSILTALGVIVYELIVLALYIVWIINIKYNFSMIPYILAEEPECSFTECYSRSRMMVRSKKKKLFSIDFCVSVWAWIAVIIPTALVCLGTIMWLEGIGGMSCMILGIFLIIPALLINIFVSVFKNAVWAKIYTKLNNKEKPEERFFSSYEPPKEEEDISYIREEKENNEE